MDNEWITVANAARILGVSKQAIRQRIYRDTIPHRKDPDGTVFVRITEHNPETNGESHAENTGFTEGVNREFIDELRDRIGFLERQLEQEQRAHAEMRRLLAGALERIPELGPAREAPSEPREDPETVSPETEGVETPIAEEEPVSWWRRMFG